MKKFKIQKNDEYLLSFKPVVKFVKIDSGRGYSWFKDKRPLEIIEEYKLEDCEVVLVEISEKEKKQLEKKSVKSTKKVDSPEPEEIVTEDTKEEDEDILFKDGFADKCNRCTKSCKQPKACTILKCPDFEKIK